MSTVLPNPGEGTVVLDGWHASPATPVHLALTARGVTTITDQASVLGEHRKAWDRYLRPGAPMPRAERVREWCERAGVKLEVGAAGWRVL